MDSPSHVFVTCGDLRYLACDAWLVPTDESMVVEEQWVLTPGDALVPPARPPRWSSSGTRTVATPGPPSDPRWRVWTNVGADRGEGVEWFVEGATQFVRAAAAAVAHAPPRFGRAAHLIALPVVGAGHGGGADRTGTIVRHLLPVLGTLAAESRLDICLVTWKQRAHAAAQSIRRQQWPRGFGALQPAAYREHAERLAGLATRGELVLFLGASLGAGVGLPAWSDLLAHLAAAAGFEDYEQTALGHLDPLDRARLVESRLRQRAQRTPGPPRAALGAEVARLLSAPWRSLSHTLLASLPVSEAATTNYDQLFELASEDAGRATAILPYRPSREHPRWLLKLHGCVTHPEDIVLTRDDYLRFAERRAALAGIVQALLVTRHMLFVGFSLTDDNFHRIVHDVRQALPADAPASRTFGTALMLEPNALIAELWKPDIDVLTMAQEAEGGGRAEVARRLEILLDAVNMLAADGTAHLLDATFDGALGDAERALAGELADLARRLPEAAWRTAAGRKLAGLLDDLGRPSPAAPRAATAKPRPSAPGSAAGEPANGRLELVALSVKDSAVRCRTLRTGQAITFRTSDTWDVVPGDIVLVRPRKQWRYARHDYVSGDIVSMRLDVQALGLVPLGLEPVGVWDPAEEYWGEEHVAIEEWARPIIARGPRPQFEMEQILPGADPDDMDSDPIIESNDAKATGDHGTARRILMQLCEADLRCLDAHAHLGNFTFGEPEHAIRHYDVGVRIGELSLGPAFEGVLSWGYVDNRPFLRCLHGYGLCCWRLGRFEDAERVFERMLWLNPSDNQGVRLLIGAVKAREAWTERDGW